MGEFKRTGKMEPAAHTAGERLRGKSKAKAPIGNLSIEGVMLNTTVWNTQHGRRWTDSLTQGRNKFEALVNMEVNFLVP
jgi:hypothetical protein